MTFDQAAVFAITLGALGLFVWGRWRYDLVALASLCAVAMFGLVPEERLFAGFGHPAVITVFLVLIVSHGLNKVGAAESLATLVAPFSRRTTAHVGALSALCAAASAFMNNVGALALLMPVALKGSEMRGRSASLTLMPLAFGSLLGGMATLIGTPPNLIVSAFRRQATGEGYAMFDFLWVGLPVAVAGVAYVALVGWRLLPHDRRRQNLQQAMFTLDGYLIELRPEPDSPLIGRKLREAELLYAPGNSPLGVARGGAQLPAVGYRIIEAGDVLIMRIDPKTLPGILSKYRLETVREDREGAFRLDAVSWRDAALLEAVVRPESRLIGKSARTPNRRFGPDFSILAVQRGGLRVVQRLRQVKLRAGDVVLIQGEADTVAELTEPLGLLPLAERGLKIMPPKRAAATIGVFAAAVLAAACGVASLPVALALAVLAYVGMGVLSARELYDEVDLPIVVLLGAMFPLGEAFGDSGAADLIARQTLALAAGWPLWGVVALLLAVASVLTNLINNAAAALLLGPIALAMADRLGAPPDALLMAAAIGASAAFMTPIGHQSNTLVMGPGGYRFSDYARMGAPLQLIVLAVATTMIVWVWG